MSTKQASATPKKPVEHPPYKDMIIAAIVNLKDRSGSSRQAIKKYIHANYKVKDNADSFIRYSIKAGVEQGIFVQPKGSSGPLKLAKKPTEKKEKKEKKPVVKKVVKKAAAKPKAKKASPKKATAAKKVVKKPVAKKATSAKAKLAAKKKVAAKKASPKPKKAAVAKN